MSDTATVLTNAYIAECKELRKQFSTLGKCALCEGFLNRWQKAHASIIETFEQEPTSNNVQQWEQESRSIIQLRMRMVSALAQGLKSEMDNQALTSSMRAFIAAHDGIFSRIIEAQHEVLKKELNDAQCVRQAIGAYARSARQMGDAKLW